MKIEIGRETVKEVSIGIRIGTYLRMRTEVMIHSIKMGIRMKRRMVIETGMGMRIGVALSMRITIGKGRNKASQYGFSKVT